MPLPVGKLGVWRGFQSKCLVKLSFQAQTAVFSKRFTYKVASHSLANYVGLVSIKVFFKLDSVLSIGSMILKYIDRYLDILSSFVGH